MPPITSSAALQGCTVLDLSRVRAGPTCVRILADFGADVIRIEPPKGIDPNEAMFAADRWSGDFQNLNRNKRSRFRISDASSRSRPGAMAKSGSAPSKAGIWSG